MTAEHRMALSLNRPSWLYLASAEREIQSLIGAGQLWGAKTWHGLRVEWRKKTSQYAPNFWNGGISCLHRTNGHWQPREDVKAKVSVNRVAQSKGCSGECMPMAPDQSNFRNERDGGKSSGRIFPSIQQSRSLVRTRTLRQQPGQHKSQYICCLFSCERFPQAQWHTKYVHAQ